MNISAYESLASEYHYNSILLNSLGMQAVIDRAFGSGTKAASPAMGQSSNYAQPSVQSYITAVDYGFIQQVTDSSCRILQGLCKLADSGILCYSPVRILLRAITASIFLLKALSMGAPSARLGECLKILQEGIAALRRSTWEDMHLASRYAALLDLYVAHLRNSFVPGTPPDGVSISNLDASIASDSNHMGSFAPSNNFAWSEWMSVPLDVSMAPFGVTGTDDAAGLPSLDDCDWDFLWGLPLAQEIGAQIGT